MTVESVRTTGFDFVDRLRTDAEYTQRVGPLLAKISGLEGVSSKQKRYLQLYADLLILEKQERDEDAVALRTALDTDQDFLDFEAEQGKHLAAVDRFVNGESKRIDPPSFIIVNEN